MESCLVIDSATPLSEFPGHKQPILFKHCMSPNIIVGIPTPNPTPIAILSLVLRPPPEEGLLLLLLSVTDGEVPVVVWEACVVEEPPLIAVVIVVAEKGVVLLLLWVLDARPASLVAVAVNVFVGCGLLAGSSHVNMRDGIVKDGKYRKHLFNKPPSSDCAHMVSLYLMGSIR